MTSFIKGGVGYYMKFWQKNRFNKYLSYNAPRGKEELELKK